MKRDFLNTGDVFSDPLLLDPEIADRKNLAAFYEAVSLPTPLQYCRQFSSFFFAGPYRTQKERRLSQVCYPTINSLLLTTSVTPQLLL